MSERRYDDDEVREIFDRASELAADTRAGDSEPGGQTGMSLAELQSIGAEAGIDPALVARAATSLDQTRLEADAPVRLLGVPVSAAHVVDLPGRLDDEDWDQLVVRLRDHFQARGTVLHEGTLRSWSNGNLQVLMEPTRTGYRLRMRTLSESIRGRLLGGTIMLLFLVVLVSTVGLIGDLTIAKLAALVGIMGGTGVTFTGSALLDSRRWTALREEQFREIGAYAQELAAARLAAGDDPGRLPAGD